MRQITFGPRHHIFGYIGHCRTIPFSGDGRWILALEFDRQDRLPGPDDVADVVLLDAADGYAARKVDRSRGWNIQQGTMFAWDPQAPERRFFFNDRDVDTGAVFAVCYDLAEGRRIREYRHHVPVGNGGMAQRGGRFLAINYGRLARLRPVTGYKGASDPTAGQAVPDNDGVFLVDVETARTRLLASFAELRRLLGTSDDDHLFINHTLWSRDDSRVFFFVRSGWAEGVPNRRKFSAACVIRPDGTGLHAIDFPDGHPEWYDGSRLLLGCGDRLSLFDADTGRGRPLQPDFTVPDAGEDKALSPDGSRLVIGYRTRSADGQRHNAYRIVRLADGQAFEGPRVRCSPFVAGDTRLDTAPCWDRKGEQVLVAGLAEDGTRQLFLFTARPSADGPGGR